MKLTKSLFAAAFVATALVGGAAHADDVDPGHPRVNEVDTRIDNQEQRVQSQAAEGKITSAQAARDDAKLTREQDSTNADIAKNGGHLTKGEDKNLNKRLNQGNKIDRRQVKKDAQ